MDKFDFQQIVTLLLEIKRSLQKGGNLNTADFLAKIDRCISKVTPYINVFGSKIQLSNSKPFSRQSSLSRSAIVGNAADNIEFDSDQFIMYRKSAGQEINKVNKSFIFKQEAAQINNKLVEPIESDVLLDYFVLRFNLAYNDYEVQGKPGPATDRKVFVDLLTYDNKRTHTQALQKTESMTNILREIFSQSKPGQPFILPNFQEPQPKYLFVFTLPECASIAKEYYRTETMCCFVSRQFMLGELSQLMNQISRFCFEQQVNEASKASQSHLSETIVQLYAKKTYKTMEKVIQNFLEKRESVTQSKLFCTKIERPFINSVEEYLQETTEMWSLVKKGKDQELIQTIILLYYLSLLEYKIVLLANTKNRHLISELVLGLTRALQPLTYIYPIVGTTITQHHFQFANSPVPIMVGFWGHEKDYQAARNALKKLVKSQKDMSASEIATETLLAVVDLEDHSLIFLDGAYKETCRVCKKIQAYLGKQTTQQLSVKLSHLTKLLVEGKRQEEWMLTLEKNMKVTQMYDYLIYRK